MEITDRQERFLEHSLNDLRMEIKACPCPRCGTPINFPIIARKEDVETFQHLLKIIYDFMDEKGITGNIYNELRDRIKTAIAIKKDI